MLPFFYIFIKYIKHFLFAMKLIFYHQQKILDHLEKGFNIFIKLLT